MNVQEARQYLGDCYNHGAIDLSDIEGKTESEIIEMAEYLNHKSEAYAEVVREQYDNRA